MSSANPTRINEFLFNVTFGCQLAASAGRKSYQFVFSKHSKNVRSPQLGKPCGLAAGVFFLLNSRFFRFGSAKVRRIFELASFGENNFRIFLFRFSNLFASY